MIATLVVAKDFDCPVAIREKDLQSVPSFTLEAHELCTMCGEWFGIGYLRTSKREMKLTLGAAELPRKLPKDHWQDQEHKRLIDLG